ncbi:MAG TPA: class I tRNA ligase family protein, partial [Oceanipulchritudo sp.]|nr:class I tRNA ligase family protein [Oceanipulchritudo sp.]
MKNFYITTAIDYANGAPHLGHAYEKVLTDVVARYRRLIGDKVYFLTGIDEHGQKVTQTAQTLGKTPEELTNEVAPMFVDLCRRLNISNDDFIRTTEKRHKDVVCSILQDLFDRGEIYKGSYKGYYSVRQEQFVLEKERTEDGSWPEIYGEVVEIEEENYFFRLSAYQDWLIEFLQENSFVVPAFRQKQVLEFLKEPVNDLCISRPKSRLSWGIELPFDSEYVTYVWFDALINYISAIGYGTDKFSENWPVDYHVIGKDILVPAHSVYWPAMLKAAGVELPKALLVHGWWHVGGQKMSKSTGLKIDPIEFADTYGADALRYFLTREMNVGQDSDFTLELFLGRYSADLANTLGNLVSRLLNMAGRNFPEGLQAATVEEDPEKELKGLWEETREIVLPAYAQFQFHYALEKTFTFITGLNRYAEVRAPWKLAKSEDPADKARLATTLANLAEGLRLANVFLKPVMPDISD